VMAIDANNPVVQFCTEGMQAEGEGRLVDAKALFTRAWEASTDTYDACIAAHYLARHQETDEETLRWNEIALERADQTEVSRLREFYPSLLLNVGNSHETLGKKTMARSFYERAAAIVETLPPGPYGDLVRDGVARALARTD
ncbi:MAG: hypothetical protein ABIT38_02860, partial [Gemmatimonadaceae bacterium]